MWGSVEGLAPPLPEQVEFLKTGRSAHAVCVAAPRRRRAPSPKCTYRSGSRPPREEFNDKGISCFRHEA